MVEQEKVTIPRHVAYRQLNDKVVIVQSREERILTLNETGSQLWMLLADCEMSAVIDAMVATYDVEPEQAEEDVKDFVATMKARGLLEQI